MLLTIKEMEVRALPFAGTWEPGIVDFTGSGAIQKSALYAEGVAELLSGSDEDVRVKGQVRTELETECDRCLGRASFKIDTPFDLFYKPASKAATDAEVAIDEDDAEIGFYELPGLELEQILAEQVLLQLPMQRVCGETCKGICPVCGANRNENDCQCEPAPIHGKTSDDRWNALKGVKV